MFTGHSVLSLHGHFYRDAAKLPVFCPAATGARDGDAASAHDYSGNCGESTGDSWAIKNGRRRGTCYRGGYCDFVK
jgi:hypothetical protein